MLLAIALSLALIGAKMVLALVHVGGTAHRVVSEKRGLKNEVSQTPIDHSTRGQLMESSPALTGSEFLMQSAKR